MARKGNIRLLTTEVLLPVATGILEKFKKLQDWISRNAVLLLPFLSDLVVTDRETAAEALLEIFYRNIKEQDTENTTDE